MTLQTPSPIVQVLPETAPFSEEQRSWLNGFFAGLLSLDNAGVTALSPAENAAVMAEAEDGAPWHDPSLEMAERMTLAEGRPLPRRLYAAMAQQDCGQCGYVCETYSAAIASGTEGRLNLCAPGGKETLRQIKALMEEPGAAATGAASEAVPALAPGPQGRCRENPALATFLSRRKLNGAALLALAVLLAVLAVVFDLGRISLARKQLQSLGDAAALAGAAELQSDSVLYPGCADTREIGKLIAAPTNAAGQRALLMAQAALEERVLVDQSTLPRGTVRCGVLNAEQQFVPVDDEFGCNTVEVRIGFTAAHKNQLPLAVTRWFGARASDVETQSIATIDGRLVGFQVAGDSPAPLLPLVVEQDEDAGWWQQAATPTSAAFNDRWQRADDGTFVAGSDGIPELLFRLGRKDEASGSTAWAASFGAGDSSESVLRQTRDGFRASDLAGLGGRLELTDDQPTYLQPLTLGTPTKKALVECLQAIAGEPRVWLLGGPDPQQGLQVTGFAAGQLVQCWDEGEAGVVVLVQPCVMQTSSALVSDDAPQNPWIAKISLAH